MGSFNIDIDLYFWLIDRGEIEDDQRNKVEIEQQRVKLHREHAQRLENAFYIGKLMHQIRKTIIKKSKKPFTLDPGLNTLKDISNSVSKAQNWNIVIQELKKFTIRVTQDEKAQIIGGKQSLIHDIVQQLFEYDQRILTFPTVIGPGRNGSRSPNPIRNQLNNNQDNNSEMNFGTIDNPLERVYPSRRVAPIDSQSLAQNSVNHGEEFDGLPSFLQGIDGQNQKSVALLSNLPKRTLEPIAVQNQSSPFINQGGITSPNSNDMGQFLDNIIGQALPEEVLGKDEAINPDSNYQGKKVGLAECTSTLDFILESLCQALGMTHSQAAALLANSQKYLMHLNVKGMKGKKYSKLLVWYKLILQNAAKLVELLEFERNDVRVLGMTFNVIKCGLFSENPDVTIMCARVLNRLAAIIYENETVDEDGGGLNPMLQDWLTMVQPSMSSGTGKLKKQQMELENLVSECGMKGFLRAYRKHKNEFLEQFAASLIQFGQPSQVELFTHHLKQNTINNLEYLQILHAIFGVIIATARGRKAFIESGVFMILITSALQYADAQNGQGVEDEERIAAMSLLAEFWRSEPEVVAGKQGESQQTEAIIQALKRGCRDPSPVVSAASTNLLFHLLDSFAKDRNMFASIIYKTLTFILIENYQLQELREEILKNFIVLFQKYPSMPIGILCDPLFKQIKINLERQEYAENHHYLSTLQQQSNNSFSLTGVDFELFQAITMHTKVSTEIAMDILDIVFQIARKNTPFTQVSLQLIMTIQQKYEEFRHVLEFSMDQVKINLKIIADQDSQKIQMYATLKESNKGKQRTRNYRKPDEFNSYIKANTQNYKHGDLTGVSADGEHTVDDVNIQEQISMSNNQTEIADYMRIQTIEKAIIDILQVLIQTSIRDLAENIKQQVLETYFKIEKKHRFRNHGLLYILGLFEKDVPKMLQVSRELLDKEKNEQKRKKQKQQILLNKQKTMKKDNKEIDEYFNRSVDLPKVQSSAVDDLRGHHPQSIGDLEINNDIDASRLYRNNKLNRNATRLKNNTLEMNINEDGVSPKNSQSKRQKAQGRLFDDFLEGADSYLPSRQNRKNHVQTEINNLMRHDKEPHIREYHSNPYFEQILLYDINDESEAEQEKYIFWIKDKLKLYKAMFKKYAVSHQSYGAIQQGTFDNLSKQKDHMSLAAVFTFLSDFKITKLEFAKRDDVKKIVKMINLKQETNIKTYSELDLEGFIEFILQLGYFMHKAMSTLPSKFLPMLFDRLKEISYASKQPMFQRLFSEGDPELQHLKKQQQNGDDINQTDPPADIAKKLTQKIKDDPNYVLPKNYVKVRQDNIKESYVPDPQKYPKESQQISLQVLDDLFQGLFDMHMITPMIIHEPKYVVKYRPLANAQPKYMDIQDRYQFQAKDPLLDEKQSEDRVFQYQNQNSMKLNRQKRLKEAKLRQAARDKDQGIDNDDSRVNIQSNASSNLYVDRQLGYNSPNTFKKRRATDIYSGDTRNPKLLQSENIRALERARRLNPSLTKLNQYTPNIRPTNKLMELKLDRQQRENLLQQERDFKFEMRQQSLKRKMAAYEKKKEIREVIKLQEQKEAYDKLKKKQELQAKQKKDFYDKIKEDYDKERLPQVQETLEAKKQLMEYNKAEEKRRKEEAKMRIKEKTALLSEQFKNLREDQYKDDARAIRREERYKKKQTLLRDKLVEDYKKSPRHSPPKSPEKKYDYFSKVRSPSLSNKLSPQRQAQIKKLKDEQLKKNATIVPAPGTKGLSKSPPVNQKGKK